jgi:hypothetical protein
VYICSVFTVVVVIETPKTAREAVFNCGTLPNRIQGSGPCLKPAQSRMRKALLPRDENVWRTDGGDEPETGGLKVPKKGRMAVLTNVVR